VDCCLPDEDYPESEDELLTKMNHLMTDPAHPQFAG
jgi:hypothetical protein